ncbi:hypothetical protein E3T39_07910 [Cryobacterium suzukii]|uniref:PKD domain-containing protein n=1 Tax=Cryobacterium suzukii TaxID=1259198 RepID=A0A4R9AGA7_9MICO|nr:PKD domain-containing protein [Cryobacterium suzukii]TFD61016.1 hypothetical protein E3T39_07910 [Cryobacterium suzukii]
MVRQKLLPALTVGMLLAFLLPGISSASACTVSESLTENCPELISGGNTKGPGVDLFAEAVGSSGGGSGNAGKSNGGSTGSQARPSMCVSAKPLGGDSQWVLCQAGLSDMVQRHPQFVPTIAAPAADCAGCSPETVVRVSDLQNFPAFAAPSGMEPNGWAIVGLAANFWAGASAQVSEGLLLGAPAQVMFTPIGYRWNYGDGSSATSTDSGASWAALGLAEFSETGSSHVYTEKGSYSVVLTVDYRADYSFGDQGWRPVEGIVSVPSTPFSVVAANESTVLVAEDCLANPRGPGC